MVFVKVRETYDLHTTRNKMTVVGIHTPKPDIIKKNYPGLLMQCKAYRPVSCDVRLACASVLPLDPLGVGLTENDVAPEDVFNPILYKAMSNKGMSQLEARINALSTGEVDVNGSSAIVDVDSVTNLADDFALYYGLLSNTKDWKHANPQSGLSMNKLKPLVYEMVYNVGDADAPDVYGNAPEFGAPKGDGLRSLYYRQSMVGKAKQMPFINCTSYSRLEATKVYDPTSMAQSGFPGDDQPWNCEVDVPWIRVFCGAIIIPPSRLHELFFRCVIEWTLEFSKIRALGDITDWGGVAAIGTGTHYQNYSYESTKEAVTGSSDSILDSGDTCMVSANVDVKKVM